MTTLDELLVKLREQANRAADWMRVDDAATCTAAADALEAAARENADLRAFRDRVLRATQFVEPRHLSEVKALIAADLKSGMSLRKCAAKHGVTFGIVRGVARNALSGGPHE